MTGTLEYRVNLTYSNSRVPFFILNMTITLVRLHTPCKTYIQASKRSKSRYRGYRAGLHTLFALVRSVTYSPQTVIIEHTTGDYIDTSAVTVAAPR